MFGEVIAISSMITLDETAGLQSNPAAADDSDGNDVAVGTLPTTFSARLSELDPAFSTDAKAAMSSTFVAIDPTSSISNLSWTQDGGVALPKYGSDATGVASDLMTLDGEIVYLFADPANDNIVFGIANGEIVFSAYIEEQKDADGDIIGAKVWMVTLEPIAHGDTNDPDDAVFVGPDSLFITASEDISFDLSTLDSGQFEWNAFGNGFAQIIVTTDAPGQTVNTSKGGGSTTIGNSNQMLDGVDAGKDPDGEAIILTFVSGREDILTQGAGIDYGDLETLSYSGLQVATGGEWSISQTQGSPSSSVTATMQAATIDAMGVVTGEQPKITEITVTGVGTFDGTAGSFTFAAPTGAQTDGVDFTIARVVGSGGKAREYTIRVDFKADGSVEITGLLAKDAIGYETNIDHNRLTLRNSGPDATSADWDIGGFKLHNTGQTSVDAGEHMKVEDDGPVATSSVVSVLVHEDALATGNADIGATQVKTATGTVTTLVNAGTDTPAVWSLSADTGGLSALTSKSDALEYSVAGDTLTAATAGGRTVFTLILEPDGDYTFNLFDQLDHAGTGDGGRLPIDLSSVLVAKDDDGDSVSPPANAFVIEVENDVPTVTAQTVSGLVHEDALASGNGEAATPTQTTMSSGSLGTLVTVGADEDLVWGLRTDTSGLTALGLKSQGEALTYSVNGATGTLTASVGVREVFTLTVGTNGAYAFTLKDQLDHATAAGDGATLPIDLSSIVVATDFDTDSVTLGANKFVITVENDVPEIGPIADGIVDFETRDFVANPLNGFIGADDRAGGNTYAFTGFTPDTSVIAGLKGQIVESGTKVVFFTDGAGGTTGYDVGTDTLFYDAILSQGTGEYTFTVHQTPPPAEITFPLSTLDSGQFRWNAFGTDEVQVIVSSDSPSTQTTNTSQGGGNTTIGNSNQMLDGKSAKDADGEAMVFTFVSDRANILTQDGSIDYGDLTALSYSNLQSASGGEWSISQTQGSPSTTVTATMKAYSTDDTGGAPNSVGDTLVAITEVTLVGPGTITYKGSTTTHDLTFDLTDDGQTFTRTIGTGSKAKTYDFMVDFQTGGIVEITGLLAKDAVEYSTDADHNRLVLQNSGDDASSADWDIGGFKLVQSQPTPDQEFDFVVGITDHDGDTATDGFSVGVDGTGIYDDGIIGAPATTADALVFG